MSVCNGGRKQILINFPPNGIIDTPASDVVINEGQTVNFTGTCTDDDFGGNTLTHLWDFGGGATNSTAADPGDVLFNARGSYNVTYVCTDARGVADPTPGTVAIAVNGPPNGVIDTPSGNTAIEPGQSINFTGTCIDDTVGGGTRTHLWDFGGGATNSTAADPGDIIFSAAGIYDITYTCTDALGVADPSPASLIITVNSPPNGSINTPSGDTIIYQDQMVTFTGTCTDDNTGGSSLTHLWDFGGGATNSTAADPGDVTFTVPGIYNLTYTCTDALGLADPTPSALTITVGATSPGSLDVLFGSLGKVTTDFGKQDYGRGIIIQGDGQIVVSGFTAVLSGNDFALARYNPDGSLDTGFGVGGKVITPLSNTNGANRLALQSSGKIIAAGNASPSANSDFALARYNTDGSLDTTFGTNGVATTDFTASEGAFDVAVQTDDKIIAVGYGNGVADFIIARYDVDGSLDTTFGVGGKVLTDFFSIQGAATHIAIQSDDKILVAGYVRDGVSSDFALARYDTDGSLDTTFDSDGKTTIDFDSNEDFAQAVSLQANGKIVLAGFATISGDVDFALARFNTDGSVDTGFGTGGKVTTNLGTDDFGEALVIQSNGKLLVAGST